MGEKNILLPEKIKTFLKRYHKGCINEKECLICNSSCCYEGGFAILENVIKIYEKYKKGELRRKDYDFEKRLSFNNFVLKYFDVFVYSIPKTHPPKNLLLFHIRTLSKENKLISIPDTGSFWQTRTELFKNNPWLSYGCVFLSKKISSEEYDDGDSSRRCILHSEGSIVEITAKPLDCIFFTCRRPKEYKLPAKKTADKWFLLLSEFSKNSVKRFKKLVDSAAPFYLITI